MAVLREAYRDLTYPEKLSKSGGLSVNAPTAQERASARAFFFSDEPEWAEHRALWCGLLDLDPGRLRSAVSAALKSGVADLGRVAA